MIEVDSLTKLYGSLVAVQDLSFAVGPGEILGLVGPNGAGKTTTLRCLAGIIPPSAGKIRIAGHALDTDPIAAKAALAFVPDEPQLFDYLTVAEHLAVHGETIPPTRRLAANWAVARGNGARWEAGRAGE